MKEIIKKPVFVKSVIGGLILSLGVLISRNIGLKNQNSYIFDKYKGAGKEYVDLATKYNNLKMKKYMDSMQVGFEYYVEILKMQNDQFKLIYQNDSLEYECINFAKKSLEILEQKRDLFERLNIMTQEKEFYKKYVYYLDSLSIQSKFKIDLNPLILE